MFASRCSSKKERIGRTVSGLFDLASDRPCASTALSELSARYFDVRTIRKPHAIAVPDMTRLRGLREPLPALAGKRADIRALFVDADGTAMGEWQVTAARSR